MLTNVQNFFLLLAWYLVGASLTVTATDDTLKFIRRRAQSDAGVGVGESCNDDSNPCAEGLECTRTPFLGVLKARRVCFPMACVEDAVQQFDGLFNVTAYTDMIFATAQVTKEEFFGLKTSKDGTVSNPLSVYSISNQMQETPAFQKVLQTFAENPVPSELRSSYQAALNACDPQNSLSRTEGGPGTGPSKQGTIGTVGVRLDAGAVIGGGVEFLYTFEGNPQFFLKAGGGLFAGADIAVAPTLGVVFTGETLDLPGINFGIDVRAPAPVIHGGFSVSAYTYKPVWGLNFVLGLSAGIHVFGFYVGHTWGYYGNGTAVCPTCNSG